jgi:hypothetical protein
MKIIWETPPAPAPGRKSIIERLMPHLQKNPGRWAKVGTYRHASTASGKASHWRKRWGKNGLEIVTRQGSVYVRYMEPVVEETPDPEHAGLYNMEIISA